MRIRQFTQTMAALFAVLIALSSAIAAENNGRIRGRIISDNGKPIAGVMIRVVSTGASAFSDSKGLFEIDSLAPGLYSLQVTHPDYFDASLSVTASAKGRDNLIEIVMKKKDASAKLAPGPVSDAVNPLNQPSPDVNYLRKSSEAPAPSATARRDVMEKTRNESGNSGTDNYTQQLVAPYKPYPSVPETNSQPYDMFFQDYGTNGFVDTRRDRFSTFGADVDDASYNLARQYLLEGNLPPQDAIRVEEFVNHFNYGYRPPEDNQFRIFTELAASPFRERTVLLKLGIKGRELANRERRPVNLTLIIDCSGSMGYDNRIELVKQSMRMLVDQLNKRDMIGIVAYGSTSTVILEPTPANRRGVILSSIDRLYPRGSTYAEAGLRLGYQMANRQFVPGHSNLVLLCSDGVANVGETSPDAIMRDVKRFANKGVILSTFGVGMGNYNDVLLEKLAREGNGRYAYVNDIDEARKQFCDQVVGNVQVLGRDMKIQVEFNPQVVASYRLLGYEKRAVPDQKFRDNRQDGGEVGSGHEVTALYELVMVGRRTTADIGTVAVRWINPGQTEVTEVQQVISSSEMRRAFDDARPEFRLAFVAAKFAEFLKGTRYTETFSLDELSQFAQSVSGDLNNDGARELADLIDRTAEISSYHSEWRE